MLRSVVLAAMLAALSPAFAGWPYPAVQGGIFYVQERGQRGEPPGRPSRDRQEAQRRQGERERTNQMTPDERRELNRDLQRANREFYRKGRDGR
jgi:hypothetical protein